MRKLRVLKSALVGGASVMALSHPAIAKVYDIPGGDLASTLDRYVAQSGVQLIYMDNVRGHRSPGTKGDLTQMAALTQILRGTGFTAEEMPSSTIDIVPAREVQVAQATPRKPAAPPPSAVETVVVTAERKKEDIQNVPIAVTALSQHQLTERQVATGGDLIRETPNMNFGKTNFAGYSIELRGIGTQAISVTTDPAVAVAFNGVPFIRNHFFEQEFFDLDNVEVLRGPQGTLWGRNATAGVVNLSSAKPADEFEAIGSIDIGNYSNRRLEGVINLPIVGDKLDLRVAGEWTKRDGYSTNELTNSSIDGRDLWSSRATLGWKPVQDLEVDLVWEHFSEDDDRLRSGKQLCDTDPVPAEVGGVAVTPSQNGFIPYAPNHYLSQGCQAASLYSSASFGVPNGKSLPYYGPLDIVGAPITAGQGSNSDFDPYASTTQSQNLRVIESTINPKYKVKNDTLELNVNYSVSPTLTLSSQTGFSNDFLWSTEDYNRFNTAPGAFIYTVPGGAPSITDVNSLGTVIPDPNGLGVCVGIGGKGTDMSCSGLPSAATCKPLASAYTNPQALGDLACIPMGTFCDPQLGCSDRLVAEDLNEERSWQLSQEFRAASDFSGPLNFSVGGNYLHYETEENYYVFINTLTLASYSWNGNGQTLPYQPGVSDNSNCVLGGPGQNSNPHSNNALGTEGENNCLYIDPNPIGSVNAQGHNYFLSQNPYLLNSYALFGEVYYNVTPDLKLTEGLRWTDDQKHFTLIPSELLVAGYGYPTSGVVNQDWGRLTGRSVINWTPQLDFTDQTLIYGSYAHGYKAGGANPPGAELLTFGNGSGQVSNPIHPLTFKPEYIDAFEVGSKNTLFDGTLTLNLDAFYYNYQNYQISRIVDRTAINDNFDAHVVGAEVESTWEPLAGLRFSFAGGWEDSTVAKGSQSVDLMDRTAGNPNWIVVKPFVTQASNCVLPTYVVGALLQQIDIGGTQQAVAFACQRAYGQDLDPVTGLAYVPNPTVATQAVGGVVPAGYPGFNPTTAPNGGQGFDKNLGGHQLPNAPPFTASFTAEYTMPVWQNWTATLHGDFYWQADSWARVFNDHPYDRLHRYTNVNLSLILNSADGWQVMGYVKNVFNTTAITGDFLNSDDSGLTTNVFLTDPRLFGIRITKELSSGEWAPADDIASFFTDTDGKLPSIWIELGGQVEHLDAAEQKFVPPFILATPRPAPETVSPLGVGHPPRYSFGEEATISVQPDDWPWIFSAAIRYGRSNASQHLHQQSYPTKGIPRAQFTTGAPPPSSVPVDQRKVMQFIDVHNQVSESHLVVDFQAGRDVGVGMFGGSSALDFGVRFAQFESKSNIAFKSDPDAHPTYISFYSLKLHDVGSGFGGGGAAYHFNQAAATASRSFHGIGPSLSWKSSEPLLGDPDEASVALDWGLNGAVLFGRQRAKVHHQTTAQYHKGAYAGYQSNYAHFRTTLYQNTRDRVRARSVITPNLGGFAGLSMIYRNAKVSFGYRGDYFFNAMDGGIDTARGENRGFFGPYARLSLGLGG